MLSFAPLCCDSRTSKLSRAHYGNLFYFVASTISGRVGQARLSRTYTHPPLYRIGRRRDDGSGDYISHNYCIDALSLDALMQLREYLVITC